MKALWCYEEWVIVEVFHDTLLLEHVETNSPRVVGLGDERLVVDPTDGDLDEAESIREHYRTHCCECPHVEYDTVSVRRSEHQCRSCGETFIDRHRPKVYFHYKDSHLS